MSTSRWCVTPPWCWHLSFGSNVLTIIGWICMKCGSHIHVLLRKNCNQWSLYSSFCATSVPVRILPCMCHSVLGPGARICWLSVLISNPLTGAKGCYFHSQMNCIISNPSVIYYRCCALQRTIYWNSSRPVIVCTCSQCELYQRLSLSEILLLADLTLIHNLTQLAFISCFRWGWIFFF